MTKGFDWLASGSNRAPNTPADEPKPAGAGCARAIARRCFRSSPSTAKVVRRFCLVRRFCPARRQPCEEACCLKICFRKRRRKSQLKRASPEQSASRDKELSLSILERVSDVRSPDAFRRLVCVFNPASASVFQLELFKSSAPLNTSTRKLNATVIGGRSAVSPEPGVQLPRAANKPKSFSFGDSRGLAVVRLAASVGLSLPTG